jgi:uncharacterized cupin superfamily protein
VVPEATQEQTEYGRVTTGEGWFVLNAREARWYHAEGRSAICEPEGDSDFLQLALNITVLEPEVQMAMYHWESDQEDFLVLAGNAILVVEGEERPLRQWDFVHCPPDTRHVLVGAGDRPCVVLAVGARAHAGSPDWGGYTVDETAARYGASVEQDTSDEREAYAGKERRTATRYREGWLPT